MQSKSNQAKQSLTLRVLYLPSKSDPVVAKFGVQDKEHDVHHGRVLANGSLEFNFQVEVQDDSSAPIPKYSGPFTHGTPAERFLYLSWKSPRGAASPWAQRIKIPLHSIGRKQLAKALKARHGLQCDVTGRRPHDTRPVLWSDLKD